MGETAGLGFALRYGHGECVAADGRQTSGAEIVHEVEVDGLCCRAWTPAGAGIVAAGQTVPEVAADRVPLPVAAAVASPRGMGEGRFTVDEDGVGLGVELVATSPAAVAGGKVAQADEVGSVGFIYGEVGGETVGGK